MSEHPFSLRFRLLNGPLSDFVRCECVRLLWRDMHESGLTLHLEPRADFCQLNLLGYLHEHMMSAVCIHVSLILLPSKLYPPERYEVLLVRERHHSLTVLLRYREQMLEHIAHPSAELRREVVKYKVWVLLGDGGGLIRSDVVAEGDVVESEVDGGAVGEVGNDHGVWQGGQRESEQGEIGRDTHLGHRGARERQRDL